MENLYLKNEFWINQDKIDAQDHRPWEFLALREPLNIRIFEHEGEEVVVLRMTNTTARRIKSLWKDL